MVSVVVTEALGLHQARGGAGKGDTLESDLSPRLVFLQMYTSLLQLSVCLALLGGC